MRFDEAKKILNDNGFILETSTYVGLPLMYRLPMAITELDKLKQFKVHYNNKKSITVVYTDKDIILNVTRTSRGIKGVFDSGNDFTCSTTGMNQADAAKYCAEFIVDQLHSEAIDRKSKMRVQESYEEDLEKLGKAMTKQGVEDYIKNVARVFATTTKSFTVEEITGLMLNYMWEFLEEYQDEGCPASVAAKDQFVQERFYELAEEKGV